MARPRTVIPHIKRFEVTIDPASTAGHVVNVMNFTVKKLVPGHPVIVWCDDAVMSQGFAVWNEHCPEKDVLRLRFLNSANSTQDYGARVFKGIQF